MKRMVSAGSCGPEGCMSMLNFDLCIGPWMEYRVMNVS